MSQSELSAAPLAATVDEAARLLRISRSKMYALIRQGKIPSVRIGTSRRVPINALRAYLDQLLEEQGVELETGAG